MSKQSTTRNSFIGHRLRDARKGQVLTLAGAPFTVLAQERRNRLMHLDLEANDGARVLLIGVPRARVRLHKPAERHPGNPPGGGEIDPVTGNPDGDVRQGTPVGPDVGKRTSRSDVGS